MAQSTQTTVPPYDRVMDVNVLMTVRHPQPIIGLGNILLLNAMTGKTPAKDSNNSGGATAKVGKQATPAVTDHPIKMTGFNFDPESINGSVGDTVKVTIKDIKPDNVTNGNITVTSKDTSVVTVEPEPNSLTFDAHLVGAGDADIEVKSNDNGVTKTIKATVIPAQAPKLEPGNDDLTNTDRLNGILLRRTDPKTGAMYREYKNIDAVAVDYDESTAVYKKAAAYFAQDNHSDRIAILDYDPSKAYDALKAFWYFNWTFAVCVNNKIDDLTLTLSNIFEANKNHFLVLQTEEFNVYTQMIGQNYTIGLRHDLSEPMDAAFVGAIATLQVGSTTWKFKELQGITPETLTTQELSGINQVHAIAYEEVMGKGQTSEGTCLSGEYIDLLHGVLWVQTAMQSRLEKLMQENKKIPYDNTGISMVDSTMTQVLHEATSNGIVMIDDQTGRGMFDVNTTPYSKQSRNDKSSRHYAGGSFWYHASSAIHSITINGTVDSDTILQ